MTIKKHTVSCAFVLQTLFVFVLQTSFDFVLLYVFKQCFLLVFQIGFFVAFVYNGLSEILFVFDGRKARFVL